MINIGTLISDKCFARSWSTLPGGCSGYTRETRPSTSAPAAPICEAIRPPTDLPPVTSVPRPIFFSLVVSRTARKHASSLLFVSGTRRPCSVYRKLKHPGPWDAPDANGHFGPGSTSKTNGGDHSKFLQLAEAPQSAPAKAAVMSVHRFFRKLMKSGPTADGVVRLSLACPRFGARRTRQPISVSKRTLAGLPTARLLFQKYYTGSIMPESSSPRPQTLTRFDTGHTAPHGKASRC